MSTSDLAAPRLFSTGVSSMPQVSETAREPDSSSRKSTVCPAWVVTDARRVPLLSGGAWPIGLSVLAAPQPAAAARQAEETTNKRPLRELIVMTTSLRESGNSGKRAAPSAPAPSECDGRARRVGRLSARETDAPRIRRPRRNGVIPRPRTRAVGTSGATNRCDRDERCNESVPTRNTARVAREVARYASCAMGPLRGDVRGRLRRCLSFAPIGNRHGRACPPQLAGKASRTSFVCRSR